MSNLKNIILSKDIIVPSDFEVFKDIYRHFKGKKVKVSDGDIPGDSRPLLEKPEEFYLIPSRNGFLQGDIISNIPSSWLAKDEEDTDTAGNQLAAFISEDRMAMVISNECDAEKRTENSQAYIRFCPVYKEDELVAVNGLSGEDSKDKAASFLGNLRGNKFTEYFWMPKAEKDGEALVADLGHICSIDLEYLYELISSDKVTKLVSLSQDAYFLLLIKMSWFFLRPTIDTERENLSPIKL